MSEDDELMMGALAEADADLGKLVDHLAGKHFGDGVELPLATSDLVQGLLDEPRWDRLELASTLGAAVARIVGGRRWCRCGVMGEEGDDRHPVDAPSLSSLVFPPAPEGDVSHRILGEGA